MAPIIVGVSSPFLLALHWDKFKRDKTVLRVKRELLEVFEEKNHHFWEENAFLVLILPFSPVFWGDSICCCHSADKNARVVSITNDLRFMLNLFQHP